MNGKIRAREVRVIGPEGTQLGVLALHEAITLARSKGMDLVEVSASANPPVCRIVDYGKFRYEQAKREKESKKHQHANRVKEIQLTASIDPHDFTTKVGHAMDFLCEEMKVKASLRFRGREMAHQEYGRQVMDRFIRDLAPFGTPIEPPRLLGRGLNVMLNPLPRNKRAKNPRQAEGEGQAAVTDTTTEEPLRQVPPEAGASRSTRQIPTNAAETPPPGFANNPFSGLDGKLGEQAA